jgi:death-on-curing protein
VSDPAREDAAEPRWISRALLDAMHDALVRQYGGMPGVLNEGAVESALGRAPNAFAYTGADLAACAAAYAFGLAKNHGYRDGNKRTAFAAAATFLRLNGHDLDADEREVVETMVLLATDRVSEAEFAEWVRGRISAA